MNFNDAHADREAPVPVEPVIYNNLKIVTENTPETMGIVQAYSQTTNELVWSTEVYHVNIKKWIEADTQWIFIKSMKIENTALIIIDEKNRTYELNPDNGQKIKKNIGTGTITATIWILLFGIILAATCIKMFKRKHQQRL
jgi:outer membrane protein assembly factor BamB